MPYMKQSLSRKASIGVWCSLAALIGIGALSYSTLAKYQEARRWERHTQQVLLSTESLLSQLKDAEVGQRGYLLTNDRQYLQPYEQSIEVVNETLAQLKRSTVDDSTQQQRLTQIDQLMTERLDILRQTITLADQNQFDAAKSIVKSNRGKVLMDQIRDQVAQMQAQENRLLQERTDAERNWLNTIVSLTIPTCLAIGLFLELLVLQLRRNLVQREAAEQALRKQNEKLSLLYDTTRTLLLADDPISLLDELYQKLSRQLGVDLYLNYLVTPRADHPYLRLASADGLTAQQKADFAVLEFGQAVCGGVAQDAFQVCLSNVQSSTLDKARLIKEIGITAYSSQPLINQGKVLGVLSFGSRSRTSFTAEEQELMQAVSDQVAIAIDRSNLLKSLHHRSEELAKSNQTKDEFLAVLSHELRTPMNPILGWVQLLRQRRFDQAGLDRALEIIERNATIQLNLIDDLLDVSRIIKGKLVLKKERVNLRDSIQSAIDTVQLSAQAKGITIEVTDAQDPYADEPYDEPYIVSGDPTRLQQIVWNLLSNAVKFTSENGKVEVRLSRTESHEPSSQSIAVVSVWDNGVGIKPEFLPHVFDHFRQEDGSSTRQFGGLGLGLAIVRYLVELHGGTVRAESEGTGKGAIFIVELPTAEIALRLKQLAGFQKDPANKEK